MQDLRIPQSPVWFAKTKDFGDSKCGAFLDPQKTGHVLLFNHPHRGTAAPHRSPVEFHAVVVSENDKKSRPGLVQAREVIVFGR